MAGVANDKSYVVVHSFSTLLFLFWNLYKLLCVFPALCGL